MKLLKLFSAWSKLILLKYLFFSFNSKDRRNAKQWLFQIQYLKGKHLQNFQGQTFVLFSPSYIVLIVHVLNMREAQKNTALDGQVLVKISVWFFYL